MIKKLVHKLHRFLLAFALLFGLTFGGMTPSHATGEIKTTDTTGKTVYAVVLAPTGTAFSVTTGGTSGVAGSFAALLSGNWTTYTVAVSEVGSTGVYVGNFPTAIVTAGHYVILVYEQQAGTAVPSDVQIAQGAIDWTGSAAVGASDLNTTVTSTNTRVTTALPNVAPGANGGLPTGDGSGRVLLQPTQTGVTIPNVTTVASVSGSVGSVTGNVGGNVTGSVGSVASATSIINALMAFQIDPLGTTPLTFVDANVMMYEALVGPFTMTTSGTTKIDQFLRNNNTTQAYQTSNTVNTSGQNTNRTVTPQTLP